MKIHIKCMQSHERFQREMSLSWGRRLGWMLRHRDPIKRVSFNSHAILWPKGWTSWSRPLKSFEFKECCTCGAHVLCEILDQLAFLPLVKIGIGTVNLYGDLRTLGPFWGNYCVSRIKMNPSGKVFGPQAIWGYGHIGSSIFSFWRVIVVKGHGCFDFPFALPFNFLIKIKSTLLSNNCFSFIILRK